MNILPKKSFHVLNKQNVERVRRDEAAERAKEEEMAQRALLAEQEARVSLMRKRARERYGTGEEGEEDGGHVSHEERQPAEPKVGGAEGGHINFFADVERGVGLRLTNVEHEAEKKADQEKLEKRIGILNYLVDKEKSDPDPWYMRPQTSGARTPNAKSEHRKQLMDPLTEMKHYVATKKKCLEPTKAVVKEKTTRRDPEAHSSHQHKHKKRKKSSELEALRRERKKREEVERARAEAVMRRHYGGEGSTGESHPTAVEEIPGRYNSQYNPHLARHS